MELTQVAESEKYDAYHGAAQLAAKIEDAMFKKFLSLSKDYSAKARSLLFNLKDAKNPGLRLKLLSGELEPNTLSEMDGKALASEAKQQAREEAKEKNLAARRTDWAQEQQKNDIIEGAFTCFKCGSKRTNYF
jgi:transcription elongation factor S-II